MRNNKHYSADADAVSGGSGTAPVDTNPPQATPPAHTAPPEMSKTDEVILKAEAEKQRQEAITREAGSVAFLASTDTLKMEATTKQVVDGLKALTGVSHIEKEAKVKEVILKDFFRSEAKHILPSRKAQIEEFLNTEKGDINALWLVREDMKASMEARELEDSKKRLANGDYKDNPAYNSMFEGKGNSVFKDKNKGAA